MSIVIAPMLTETVQQDDHYDWLVTQEKPFFRFPVNGRVICRGDVLQLRRKHPLPGQKKTTADFEILGISSSGKGEDMVFNAILKPITLQPLRF